MRPLFKVGLSLSLSALVVGPLFPGCWRLLASCLPLPLVAAAGGPAGWLGGGQGKAEKVRERTRRRPEGLTFVLGRQPAGMERWLPLA